MRLIKMELENFKNIKNSIIEFKSNMSAIYGPNGTGKTAIVDALKLLQDFYYAEYRKKDVFTNDLINVNEDEACIKYYFNVDFTDEASLEICIELNFVKYEDNVVLKKECYSYRELGTAKKYKSFYCIELEDNMDTKYTVLNNKKIPIDGSVNRLFYQSYSTLEKIIDIINNDKKSESNDIKSIIANLRILRFHIMFNSNIITLKEQSYQNLALYLQLTYRDYKENHYDVIVGFDNENKLCDIDTKNKIELAIEQISEVFNNIIPDSELIVDSRYEKTVDTVDQFIVNLYVKRGNNKIPIENESTGIRKLISILASIIRYYNDENYLLVIDELDAHIFEYLLSRILEVLKSDAKGQLVFTTHNLSPMETLEKENIILSTYIDDNVEFNYFTRVSNTTNLRNKYIRAYSLGAEENIKIERLSIPRLKHSLKSKM